MKYQIITISRQFGSGGRTIGKKLAEQLGIPCYDQELLEMIAEESGMSKEYVKKSGEETVRTGPLSFLLEDRTYDTPATQDWVWEGQKKVIEDLANKGPCVIVGRCADHILWYRNDVLRVLIHADDDKRAKRIVEVYGEREESPEKRVKEKDKRRAAYYKKYTKKDWGIAADYHISLDSGDLGIDTCVDILAHAYTYQPPVREE